MGYDTDFSGQFDLDKPLTAEHKEFLTAFAQTRRMRRDVTKLDPNANANVGLGLGDQGAYYVGGGGFMGQDVDSSVIGGNTPPDGQPGLWCQWIPDEDNDSAIVWDEGEKFYEYDRWIVYIIEHFLKPWGYTLNGEVVWHGEGPSDIGMICVKDNEVTLRSGRVIYE